MLIEESILINELKNNKVIDPKKYSLQMLKRLQSMDYIVLLLNEQKEAISVGKGKSFYKALGIYLNIF